MNRLTAFAAAFAIATMLSSVAAKAEYNYGPVQNGNQCFKHTGELSYRGWGWGYWAECPKPASATTVTRRARRAHQ